MNQFIFVSRITQILISLIAFSIPIASLINYNDYYHDNGFRPPNGFLMMASIMTLFDVAALGCIGLLALIRPADIAMYLVLVFDILALIASIAAGKCTTHEANDWQGWNAGFRIVVGFSYVCSAIISAMILRTIYVLWQNKKPWMAIHINNPLKPHSDYWTPEEIQRLEQRVEQLETDARLKPFTPSETIARWTTFSGNETLSDFESEKAR